jgi:DNA-binding NtrC family response regulator
LCFNNKYFGLYNQTKTLMAVNHKRFGFIEAVPISMKPLMLINFDQRRSMMGKLVPFKLFGEYEIRENGINVEQHKQCETEFWFASTKIKQIAKKALEAAKQDVNILISGETGVGKTLFAKYIKENSLRAEKPFIVAPVCSIPEDLIASELFGHKKGAFTGAIRDHSGYFKDADGGTIFLDEIGDLPLGLQVQLLSAVQEKIISPVGGKSVKVDVRIISATNKNLKELVSCGLFREDLFYRLTVLDLRIPPLKERPEDIKFLAQRMLETFCRKFGKDKKTFTKCAIELMLAYPWPGNVREIENVIQRLVVHGGATISAATAIKLYAEFQAYEVKQKAKKSRRLYDDPDVAAAEAKLIRKALDNNMTMKAAALELGIAFRTLQDKVKALGIVTARKKKMLRYRALEEEQIREALDKTRTQREAAVLLGIPPRTFEDKLKKLGIKTQRKPRISSKKINPINRNGEAQASKEETNILEMNIEEQRAHLLYLFEQNNWSQKKVANILRIPVRGRHKGLYGLIIKHKLHKEAPEGIWFGKDYEKR